MKTVIEMAKEAGFEVHERKQQARVGLDALCGIDSTAKLERFAELVRADQDEKYKWDVHSCGPTCTNAVCVAMREAVEAEREACERVAGIALLGAEMDLTSRVLRAIRARRNT